MKSTWRILSMSLLAVLLVACGGADAEPTQDVNAALTGGVETLVAAFFQTQTALYTPPVDTQTPPPVETVTLAFTPVPSVTVPALVSTPTLAYILTSATPSPTGTLMTPTPDPASLAYKCNNLALVYDVTIPSGTTLQPGEAFTKTWKVANTGTCDWKYPYRLLHVGGETFGNDSVRLGKTIVPGKWTEISIRLEAPRAKGTYSGNWRMSDGEGNLFGGTLSVSIKVVAPATDTPIPTQSPTSTPTGTPTDTPETSSSSP